MGVKEIAAGTIITVVIGGAAYTVNQADVVDNFASDTGLTQQQAEQYVKEAEDDLISYEELSKLHIEDGEATLDVVSDINCDEFEYEWESPTLTCEQGKSQLNKIGNGDIALGKAFEKLDSSSATREDISATITLIDKSNANYDLEVADKIFDPAVVDESKKSNSYNKATLEAALEGN